MSSTRKPSLILFVAFALAGFCGEAQARDTATTLSAENVSGPAGSTVTVQAILKTQDGQKFSPLPNKTVQIYFRQYVGNTYSRVLKASGTTNSSGTVKFTVKAPSPAGKVYVYDIIYEGDSTTRRSSRYVQVTAY